MKKIIDYISRREIWSNNPKKTVKELLHQHNTVWVKDGDIHFPENAFAEELDDVIVIRKGKLL